MDYSKFRKQINQYSDEDLHDALKNNGLIDLGVLGAISSEILKRQLERKVKLMIAYKKANSVCDPIQFNNNMNNLTLALAEYILEIKDE